MQYKVEITVRRKDGTALELQHDGDIIHSKDLIGVVYSQAIKDMQGSISFGLFTYACIQMWSRQWYFGTWQDHESTELTKDDKINDS